MSSDFLYDVEDDENNAVLLTMRASGFAELTIMEHDKLIEDTDIIETEGKIASLRLLPDESGWKNAEKIADALNSWVAHTKNLKL
jgi:hypothetical protein